MKAHIILVDGVSIYADPGQKVPRWIGGCPECQPNGAEAPGWDRFTLVWGDVCPNCGAKSRDVYAYVGE